MFASDERPTPIDADPAELAGATELVAARRDAVAARREAELRCARLLARMADEQLWASVGCANVGEFAERHDLAAIEARALVEHGLPHFRSGRVSPPIPAFLAQVASRGTHCATAAEGSAWTALVSLLPAPGTGAESS